MTLAEPYDVKPSRLEQTKALLRDAAADRRRVIRESLKRERHDADGARMGNLSPAPERRQHGEVVRVADQPRNDKSQNPSDKGKRFGQYLDAAGNAGDPYRGLSLLDQWEKAGRITKEMHDAGDEFHRLFHQAALDPLASASWSRVGGSRGPANDRGNMNARKLFHDALDALGGLESMLGSCAWSVLGEERSIRHWAGIYGRATIGRRAAEMAVSGALGALKVHFGF